MSLRPYQHQVIGFLLTDDEDRLRAHAAAAQADAERFAAAGSPELARLRRNDNSYLLARLRRLGEEEGNSSAEA